MKLVLPIMFLASLALAASFKPSEQSFGFQPSQDQPAIYVFYFGTNSGEYQYRVALTNLSWATATNELAVGISKTNLVGGVTNFVTATAATIQGTNLVEGLPSNEINFVPPRPPTVKLSTAILQATDPKGPWTVMTNLVTIELAADAERRFYKARMDVK